MGAQPQPQEDVVIPDHVPPELVRNFSFWTTPGMAPQPNGNPQAALSFVHYDMPRVFYAPRNMYDGQGTWVITRADDQRRILQDAETFSNNRYLFTKALGEDLPMVPLEIDPPHHGKYRMLLNPMMSPKKVDALEPAARARCADLIEGFKDRGECEVLGDFALPYSVGVALDFLGLPQERGMEFVGWAKAQLHGTPEERLDAMRTVVAFMKDLMAEKKKRPTDDFMSVLLRSEVENRPLNDLEVLGISILLFEAGYDNVAAGLGFGLNHLAQHPDDQARLRAQPELIKSATEEFMRAYSTVQLIRRAVKDVEFEGVQMKEGDFVSCATMIANRDPLEFADPDRVDIARADNRHVAFAYGPHRCLGSHLARKELNIGYEEFLGRIPTFRVKDGTAPTTYGGHVFGIDNLVLAWT
jgi:cytochrome P450